MTPINNQAKGSPPDCILATDDDIAMACDCRGSGEPLLLFIHGWTCRRSYWAPQLSHFASRYRVAAPDLAGHGETGTGRRTRWTVDGLARDMENAAGALGADNIILIGHSMGGAVALETARGLKQRASGVVLVDTFVIDYGGLAPEVQESIAAPFETDFPAAIAALVEQTSTEATPPELKERLTWEMSTADTAWALPLWRDLLAWNPAPAFADLQVPIHAINGALIPGSARERCAPHFNEAIIAGAGHFPQMEDPDGFNRVLEQVLHDLCAGLPESVGT